MKKDWQSIVIASLVSAVLSGGAMMVRGDMLGSKAADTVKSEISKDVSSNTVKIEELKTDMKEDIADIKASIEKLNEKFDKILLRGNK